MSKHNRLRFFVVLLFAATAVAALVSADFGALAQNSNGSTTGDESMQNSNANMAGPMRHGRRRGRRGRRRARPAATVEGGSMIDPNGTNAAATGDASAATQSEDVSGQQTDLSGTYTGHLTMTGGHEMSGEATLTITGNTFQLAGEGMNHGGRVYAVTTRGYTGAAFYFTDLTDPTTSTPVVANTRARKSGDRLWLMPVPNTRTSMTFGSPGGGGGGRHRGSRGRRGRRGRLPAATPEPTGDGTTPPV